MRTVPHFAEACEYDDHDFFVEFLRLAKYTTHSTAQGEQKGDRCTKFHLLRFWISHSLWAMTNPDRADFINREMHTYKGRKVNAHIDSDAVKTAVRRLGF